MFKIMLALHLLTAIFAVGPLVHAATTASRGVRKSDGAAVASSARLLRIYSIASVLVVIFGFALMSSKRGGHTVAQFSDTYIWLSLVLWAVAMGLIHGVLSIQLEKIGAKITAQESVAPLTAKIAMAGGLVGVIFAVIVFLMVYRPGS